MIRERMKALKLYLSSYSESCIATESRMHTAHVCVHVLYTHEQYGGNSFYVGLF